MSLITELRRRNVIRVAMAYIALAWLVVQVLDSLAPLFGIGDSASRLIVILMAIGLVPVLVVSWLFELTPEGFKREGEVDHDAATSRASARRLDRVIIGVLAVAVVYFAVDKFVIDPARDAEVVAEATEKARTEALLGEFGDRSIAVLPFADDSADGDQEYLSDGIAEEIINLLSSIREIRVISRSSSFAFRDRTMPLAEVADRLNVRYVMEGSVRRAGETLRITAQMIDPRTDTALWSENFDRDFGDVFAIQDEIAGEVVDKLEIELKGGKPRSKPVDTEAYALYLRAKDLVSKQNWTATQEAEALLEQSLAIDDQHAAAWLLYWPINSQKVFFSDFTFPEFALVTRDAIENALRAEPMNAKARSMLARLSYAAMSTWEGEAKALAYGMSLDPLDPEINSAVGTFLRTIGVFEKAESYFAYALARDPLNAATLRGMMSLYRTAGNAAAGLEMNQRLHDITGGTGGLWNRGMFYLMLGDAEKALEAFDEWGEAQPDSPHAHHGRALANLRLGHTGEFERNLSKLEEAGGAPDLLAHLYIQLGRYDDAIEALSASINPPRSFGPPALRTSVFFTELHDHPFWQELLERRGTSETQLAAIGLDKLFPGPGLPPTVPVSPP